MNHATSLGEFLKNVHEQSMNYYFIKYLYTSKDNRMYFYRNYFYRDQYPERCEKFKHLISILLTLLFHKRIVLFHSRKFHLYVLTCTFNSVCLLVMLKFSPKIVYNDCIICDRS